MAECIFCKIASKEMKGDIVREDDDIVVFRDIHPQAPVHLLIIPKKHISGLIEVEEGDTALLGKIARVVREIAEELSLAKSGFRLVANSGPNAGQAVEHLHFHLLGGRKFGWPPG